MRQPHFAMHAFATSERFAHLDRKDRDRLEAISKLDEFEPGEEILAAGHPNDSICLVVSGLIEVRAKTRRGEVVLCQLRPGDLFGEVEAFAALPEGVRYIASEDTIVRAVPKNPLRHELLAHRSLAVGLLHAYSRPISEKTTATETAKKNALFLFIIVTISAGPLVCCPAGSRSRDSPPAPLPPRPPLQSSVQRGRARRQPRTEILDCRKAKRRDFRDPK